MGRRVRAGRRAAGASLAGLAFIVGGLSQSSLDSLSAKVTSFIGFMLFGYALTAVYFTKGKKKIKRSE